MSIVRIVLWLLILALIASIIVYVPTFGIVPSGISIIGALLGGVLLDSGMRRT
jgi:hypothetical protein